LFEAGRDRRIGVMGDLDGRVAIVTGAAGGVGRATVGLLRSRGARVVAVDIAPAVQELEGDDVAVVTGDAADAATAETAVRDATRRWERIDILVNNAAQIVWKTVVDTTEEEWDRVLAVNVRSAFLMSRAALPTMVEQGRGSIVQTASISGLSG